MKQRQVKMALFFYLSAAAPPHCQEGWPHPSAHMLGKQKVKKTGLKEAGIKEGILMIVI
ncbi:hypothetical protein B4144_2750 [Bacillus atrophaeus]|nr:hypothetical protein B4144_2750 [Bacillus atrophaeus]